MFQFANDYYKLLLDAYQGAGGFRDGSNLITHPRETADKYLKRKQLAYYLNYVAPIVNSHVNPVFGKQPARDWGDNAQWQQFVEDVDTNGTGMHRFMKRAGMIAKLKGVVFIVVDNVAEQPATMADVLQGRLFPYIYAVEPQQIKSYTTNKAGRLTSITYTVTTQATQTDTAEETWQWTASEWICRLPGGATKSGFNPTRRVPVIPLFSKPMTPGEILPQSEFFNIVQTNCRIYNLCSEIDELIRNQAFNVLTYPQSAGQEQEDVKEIVVGTENVMSYDGSLSNKPEYIAPDSGPLQELRAYLADLVKEIYRMAALSHVTGVEQKASGVAKQWDFEQTNQILSDFALNCESAELEIAKLFELWTNTTVGYTCQYSTDFGIVDVTEELAKAEVALGLRFGNTFGVEVAKKVMAAYMPGIEPEAYDRIVREIETNGLDTIMSQGADQP